MRHSVGALIVAGAVLITCTTDRGVFNAAAATPASSTVTIARFENRLVGTRPELTTPTRVPAPNVRMRELFGDLAVLGADVERQVRVGPDDVEGVRPLPAE